MNKKIMKYKIIGELFNEVYHFTAPTRPACPAGNFSYLWISIKSLFNRLPLGGTLSHYFIIIR